MPAQRRYIGPRTPGKAWRGLSVAVGFACGRHRPTAHHIRPGERAGRPPCGVQLYATTPDGQRKPGDGLAISLSETADGTLADALTEHSDDFDLLVAGEIVHGGRNPTF